MLLLRKSISFRRWTTGLLNSDKIDKWFLGTGFLFFLIKQTRRLFTLCVRAKNYDEVGSVVEKYNIDNPVTYSHASYWQLKFLLVPQLQP